MAINLLKTSLFSVFYFTISLNIGLSQSYPIQPVPFNKVKITDDFWAPKIKRNHEVTIPIAFSQSYETGRIDNFKIAGDLMEGQFCTQYPFDDSDIYKMIEAASYSLQTFPDKDLEARVDTLIEYIAAAQEEDGYLFTNRTIGVNLHSWVGEKRWEFVHELSHELYNLGHLFEGAVAHYEATGKRSLLDIALKAADLICEEFGEGKIMNVPGHQEVELGLVKLYRITGKEKYLTTAKFFLDIRGREGVGNPKEYDQSHLPVIEQREAVGHSVRGAYMWAAMADIAALTGEKAYITAIDAIWHDIVDMKYYINGGIGATGNGEAFGKPYELPNMSAYCETCAGVGNAKWNHRMFLMHGESKYIDVLERTMYNNILDGISLSGDRFFYPNPLASAGQHERQAWFGCACCPPNVARFLPSMPGYIYAQKENDVYINLYISSETSITTPNGDVKIIQESDFPWDGNVKMNISSTSSKPIKVKFRIPGYVNDQPVPSDLYTYYEDNAQKLKIKLLINGLVVPIQRNSDGYVEVTRKWNENDQVTLTFPFEIHKVLAHENVTEDVGKVAIERGPLLYCMEWPDVPDNLVLSKFVNLDDGLELEKSEDLGKIYKIKTTGKNTMKKLDGSVANSDPMDISLIPYHLWNNRGAGEMTVWIPYQEDVALPVPAPTIARRSKVSASIESKAVRVLNDQLIPKKSNERTTSYFHWWPKADSEEWVQFDFDTTEKVSGVEVFWYDDGPHGGCRIPESWEVWYKKGNEWVPVSTIGEYPIEKDKLNSIHFKPVTTTGIKIKVQLSKEYSTGLYEVIIN